MIKQGHFKGQQSQFLANIPGPSNSKAEGVQFSSFKLKQDQRPFYSKLQIKPTKES